jgi:alpha-tubulin suppressor-like RCC1 family protein
MPAIDITKIKYTWRGQWLPGSLYNKNDIVQFQNAAYVCTQTLPSDYDIAFDTSTAGTIITANVPEPVLADKRPDNRPDYWRLVVRGNTFKRGWMAHRTYQQGDIVRYGANLYMYVGNPGWGAQATATINGTGQVVGITITNAGYGYTTAPSVIITGGNQLQTSSNGSTAYALVSNGAITNIILTHAGNGYISAPTVQFQVNSIRNTHPEDTTYWVKIFQNPNQDQHRMYAVATPNMQPLGWTRNNGDYPNPQFSDGESPSFIDSLGVPYSCGGSGGGTAGANSYNTSGRGVYNNWVNMWQPAGFSFTDWLRSTDNQTALGTTALGANVGLPTPDGLPPKCIQWIRTAYQSLWLMNNGEVYFAGRSQYGEAGVNVSGTDYQFPQRCTNQSNVGYLNETLPKNFNNTKIIKVDMSSVGSSINLVNTNNPTSVYALGNDGSLWVWGYNVYGQLGLGQQTAGTGSITTQQNLPTRIPAVFFDNKKIVDFMVFGYDKASVLALDEDGDLWGWGADWMGELGLGSSTQGSQANYRQVPTRIPFDFKRYGGIKKMSYYHHTGTTGQTAWARAAFILTADGSLFGAGMFYGAATPTNPDYINSQNIGRWTRFMNSGGTNKLIDNFWVVGNEAYVIYIRERDTGLTYAMGSSKYGEGGHLGSVAYTHPNLSGTWNVIKGPKFLSHVTNNEADGQSVSAADTANTIVLIEENGRAWGQGKNTKGSLSLGTAGANTTWYAGQNPETGYSSQAFQPLYIPSGARIATAMGHGAYSQDIGVYITDDGQCLISGSDTLAASNISYHGIQGQVNGIWWYNAINTTNQYTAAVYDRYFMHTMLGD